jgi:hypothetical protein
VAALAGQIASKKKKVRESKEKGAYRLISSANKWKARGNYEKKMLRQAICRLSFERKSFGKSRRINDLGS